MKISVTWSDSKSFDITNCFVIPNFIGVLLGHTKLILLPNQDKFFKKHEGEPSSEERSKALPTLISLLKERSSTNFFLKKKAIDSSLWEIQNEREISQKLLKLNDMHCHVIDFANVMDVDKSRSRKEPAQVKVQSKIKNDFCIISIKSNEVFLYCKYSSILFRIFVYSIFEFILLRVVGCFLDFQRFILKWIVLKALLIKIFDSQIWIWKD